MIDRDRWTLEIHFLVGSAAAFALSLNVCSAANRDALRQIVQGQCAVHWSQQHSASPCERIYLPEAPHEREGFAVLADRKGGAHFLLIPTRTIAGMESTELLEPGAPNYFAAAWSARDLVARSVGHGIPRDAVGLALNPRHARTQDQMHIHIECLRADVALALRRAAPRIAGGWSPISIDGRPYQALRVMGEELGGANPPVLLANGLPAARSGLGDFTLVVAGMDFPEGPGFVLLAGNDVAGELLLDSTCAMAATP
jgi:CDP-diacylglycerol pyrophosphatase